MKKNNKKRGKINGKYSVTYQRTRIYLDTNPRVGVCEGCRRSRARGEIKSTHRHHWKYSYRIKTVRKNPKLALESTSELCYSCHKDFGDPLRLIFTRKIEDVDLVVNTAELMPESMRKKMDDVAKEWIRRRRKHLNR